MAILNAGVESSEDAPFVSTNYQFFAGDFVYFSFQVAGFEKKVNEEAGTAQIALAFEVTMTDAKGIPLAKSESGEIKEPLHPEDKNWIPKRRASFLIPSFIAGGEYRVHVSVKDLLSGKTASIDVPFQVGGPHVQETENVDIQHFAFLRQEDGSTALAVAAYRPGDTIYISFDATNFALAAGNRYRIEYGVLVLGPDGEPFLSAPKAAQLEDSSFYPAQILPCRINILTKSSSTRGAYVVVLTLTDLIARKSREVRKTFTLE
ncbi:MAG TPA: hypothetical protein VH351_20025 [Bryobacteraceae bacterium]|nr:hypothetical protein [Bryobacteraceae bacterium]